MCMRPILCVSSSLFTVQWVVTVCATPSSWRRVLLLYRLDEIAHVYASYLVCMVFFAPHGSVGSHCM
jgi:hypothetical protein